MMKKNVVLTLLLVVALLSACVDSIDDPPVNNVTPTDNTWTVKFNLDGGKISGATTLADVKVTKGSSLGTKYPAAPTREGTWSFGGWFDESVNPYVQYQANTAINKDLTLKAKWNSTETNKWVVSFDTDGGIPPSIESIQVNKGESMGGQYPTDPTKARHEFEGWYLASDTGFSGTKYESSTNITANTDLKAKWKSLEIAISINITGGNPTSNDSVSVEPESGIVGEEITIYYNLAGGFHYNQLNFTGITSVNIEDVTTSGSDTIMYTIDAEDATDGVITINAVFTHSNKPIVTMTFDSEGNETRTYGDAPFTKAVSNPDLTGISYFSSVPTVATVNSDGTVTILKAGNTIITATKTEDTNTYAPAVYELTVEQLQLIKDNPTVTTSKQYDGTTTAAVTAIGALTNKVGSDTVTVTAEATYASEDAGTGITINVVYSISGAHADNYIKPIDYTTTGEITKAVGRAVSVPTVASKTHNKITVNAVTVSTPTYGQTAEYTISSTVSTVVGLTGSETWQDGLTFSGLTASTAYYVFARAKANDNCNTGVAQVSAAITTNDPPPPPLLKYDFSGGDTIPASYPGLSGSYPVLTGSITSANIVTSNATDGFFKDKQVLTIIKTDNSNYSSPKFVLPFNLGDKTLADYSHIILVARSASASNVDQSNKKMFVVEAGSSSTRLSADVNNNFNLGNNNNNTVMTIIMPISFTAATQNLTGVVELGFLLDNLKGVNFEIASITLIGSPFGYNISGGDTIPANYPVLSGSISSANIVTSNATDGFFKDKQVINIVKPTGNANPKFVLPFDLGSNTLADYSYIIIVARSASTSNVDQQYKTMLVQAGSSSTEVGTSGNNGFNLGNVNNNTVMTIIIPITFTPAKNFNGTVELGFLMNNVGGLNYEIASISLLR